MDDLIDYLGSYLIGSIPVGFLLLKIFKNIDLRKKAKGQIGVTQVWKTTGPTWGLLTLASDILKGASAVFMAHILSPADPPDMIAAGFLVILGDEFPVFLRFKGNRNIGVTVGVFASLLYCMLVK
jgi:glycerol-3-phosphate acyltransferase PlsY